MSEDGSTIERCGSLGHQAGRGDQHIEVVIDKLSHSFANGMRAIKEMSMVIASGEFVALVGPSGCGKSTLLRIIAGLIEPTSGRVEIHVPDDRRSFVFQDATLLAWRSVFRNVELPLELRHVPSSVRGRAARGAIRLVGLADYESVLPAQLSGGMRMRVSIARALVADPLLLLMDEPFGALDEITRQTLQSELLALWEEQRRTVIFVTHNVTEAVYLSNKVVVMTPSPGSIADVVDVSLPYPRNRTSSEFAHVVDRVSASLIRHMRKAV